MGLYDDLDILIEGYEEAQQALDGKLAEVSAEHLGNIRLGDSEQRGGFSLLQMVLFEDGIDFEDKLRLDEMLFGVRKSEIFEDVTATHLVSFPAHASSPFAIRSASRRRCLTNSMSRCGVSRPAFDFFWKACNAYTASAYRTV